MKPAKYPYILIALLLFSACTHRLDTVEDNTPAGNFKAMWKIIDQKYCYIDEKNIRWDSVYEVYLPRFDTMHIKTYKDNYTFFDLLAEPLNQLHDGHVNLYSTFDISSSKEWYEGYPANFNSTLLYAKYLTDYHRASALKYCLIDNDSIGYIYLSSFSSSFSDTNLNAVLRYFASCKGIIIDVRNNGGGEITNAYKLASPFFAHDTVIGYWQHKTGPGHTDFSSLEPMRIENTTNRWKKPVVVLSNRQSYSATNLFISLMRYADKCKIVGGISGGGGGMPLSYELPNGWLIRLSSIKMYDRNKVSIEEGITPDVLVQLTSSDKDDIIETAISTIHDYE